MQEYFLNEIQLVKTTDFTAVSSRDQLFEYIKFVMRYLNSIRFFKTRCSLPNLDAIWTLFCFDAIMAQMAQTILASHSFWKT